MFLLASVHSRRQSSTATSSASASATQGRVCMGLAPQIARVSHASIALNPFQRSITHKPANYSHGANHSRRLVGHSESVARWCLCGAGSGKPQWAICPPSYVPHDYIILPQHRRWRTTHASKYHRRMDPHIWTDKLRWPPTSRGPIGFGFGTVRGLTSGARDLEIPSLVQKRKVLKLEGRSIA